MNTLSTLNSLSKRVMLNERLINTPPIISKSGTYELNTYDKIITVDTTSGWTLTLYPASGNSGRTVEIVKTSSDTNSLTIDGNGSETINGSANFLLDVQYESVLLYCDGSNWLVVKHHVPLIAAIQNTAKNDSLVSGNDYFLAFTNEVLDTHGISTVGTAHSTTTNDTGSKFIIPKAGKYITSHHATFDTAGTNWAAGETYIAYIKVGGSEVQRLVITGQGSSGLNQQQSYQISGIHDLSKNDRVEFNLFHNQGANAVMLTAAATSRVSIQYVGS